MAARRCLLIALTLSSLTSTQCGDAALQNTHAAPESDKGAAIANKGVAPVRFEPIEPALSKGTMTDDTEGVSDLFKDLLGKIHETTLKPGVQWVVALLALLLGMSALSDGKATLKAVVILICAGCAFTFALTDFEDRWKDVKHGELYSCIASFEIAAAVGYVAWKGMEGVKFGLGMTAGFLMFQEVKVLMEAKNLDSMDSPMYACAAGTILVLFGLFLFTKRMEGFTTGIIFPILGAGAIVSSLGYFLLFGISFLGKPTQESLLNKNPLGEVPAFESFVLMIFKLRSANDNVVGFFNVAGLNSTVGSVVLKWDLILGRTFLVIFALFGIYYQLKKDSNAKKAARRQNLRGPMAEGLILKRPSNY